MTISKATSSILTRLKEGHKIASGTADNSPYPDGSIRMQSTLFRAHGINIDSLHQATLNLSIAPHKFNIKAPEFTIKNLHWAKGFPPEDFSFSKCKVEFDGITYEGFIYYPHPETKIGHFHDSSLIEVITYFVPELRYGDNILLKYNPSEINIT